MRLLPFQLRTDQELIHLQSERSLAAWSVAGMIQCCGRPRLTVIRYPCSPCIRVQRSFPSLSLASVSERKALQDLHNLALDPHLNSMQRTCCCLILIPSTIPNNAIGSTVGTAPGIAIAPEGIKG